MKRVEVALVLMLMIWALPELTMGQDYKISRSEKSLSNWEFVEGRVLGRAEEQPGADAAREVTASEAGWESVSIPHVFLQSGLPDNTAGWYRTRVEAKKDGRRTLLKLEGAASITDVYVNGEHAGRHRGAYTAVVFDVTDHLRSGADNEIALRVSNGDVEASNSLSHSVLYYTNGGLYRPAWLIETGPVMIEPYMGSTGVLLTGEEISEKQATLRMATHVRNTLERAVEVQLRQRVAGPGGELVGETIIGGMLGAGEVQVFDERMEIADPALWDVHQPNLYTVATTLTVDGQVMDAVTERTGFRTIAMDEGKFMLNGRELLIRGVNKHQQTEHAWNAISNEELAGEWDLMEELGVNTVRLAHYPHRRFEYDIADEKGLAVWAENGLAGQLWEAQDKRDNAEREPTADGERITREMVVQNWNHPSILFWSSGNETYDKVAARYAEVIREQDKTRLITYASANRDRPETVDFIANNTYQGWYGNDHYSKFSQLPRNKYVSETGLGTWVTHHVPQGVVKWTVDKFEPMEYGNLYTEYRLQSVFKTNPEGHKMYLWWNFREFYDRKFKRNRNTKGLITIAGRPKDLFYLHKAFMAEDQPMVYITGRDHFYRQFAPDDGIKVFSTAESVELFVNGESRGVMRDGEYHQPISAYPEDWKNAEGERVGERINHVFFWKTPLAPGRNAIEARGSDGQTDTIVVYQHDMTSDPRDPSADIWVHTNGSALPAVYIRRPVEPQSPFYLDVDGSSDNTFDELPLELEGANWIATKRMSDPANRATLGISVRTSCKLYVMHSTGTFPPIVLREPDTEQVAAAKALSAELEEMGFKKIHDDLIWRGHDMWLANAALWEKEMNEADYELRDRGIFAYMDIPGQTLDYVVMVKPSGGKVAEASPVFRKISANNPEIAAQYERLLAAARANGNRYPRTLNEKGEVVYKQMPWDWTLGFFPGSLWQLHDLTGDPKWREAALEFARPLEPISRNTGDHDVGFILMSSFGHAWGDDARDDYREVLVRGAESLATRFNPNVGCTRSWDFYGPFPVIIDNMMNLELLMWASKHGGDGKLSEIANTHAQTTLKNHFRPDGSSYHLVNYDPETGGVTEKRTWQGAANESAWARGQSWGLYGYTMMYRETGQEEYLEQAQKVAAFLLGHPNMPQDMIPYWDFNAPGIPDAPRDASAAAIMASALFELSTLTDGDVSRDYFSAGERILHMLCSPDYLATGGEQHGFLIKHCVGSYPENREIDVPLNYADYYFLEALNRYLKNAGKPTAAR